MDAFTIAGVHSSPIRRQMLQTGKSDLPERVASGLRWIEHDVLSMHWGSIFAELEGITPVGLCLRAEGEWQRSTELSCKSGEIVDTALLELKLDLANRLSMPPRDYHALIERDFDIAAVHLERVAERRLEFFGSVADDRDARRLEPEPEGLAREERSVQVGSLTAHRARCP